MAQPECGMWVDYDDDDAALRRENANGCCFPSSQTPCSLLPLPSADLLCQQPERAMTQPIWCSCWPKNTLKFSMPLLSNNLLAILCHRRVFYFPHCFSISCSLYLFFFFRQLKVRDGQNEHVADKGGVYSPVQSSSSCVCVCVVCVWPCSRKRERECNANPFPGRSGHKSRPQNGVESTSGQVKYKKKERCSYATLARSLWYVKCVFGLFSILITDP